MQPNDKEHKGFEKFGAKMGLDLEMHPLHLLYLNPQTANYLEAFKAGYSTGKDLGDYIEDPICCIALCNALQKSGVDTSEWDGDDCPENIIAWEVAKIQDTLKAVLAVDGVRDLLQEFVDDGEEGDIDARDMIEEYALKLAN